LSSEKSTMNIHDFIPSTVTENLLRNYLLNMVPASVPTPKNDEEKIKFKMLNNFFTEVYLNMLYQPNDYLLAQYSVADGKENNQHKSIATYKLKHGLIGFYGLFLLGEVFESNKIIVNYETWKKWYDSHGIPKSLKSVVKPVEFFKGFKNIGMDIKVDEMITVSADGSIVSFLSEFAKHTLNKGDCDSFVRCDTRVLTDEPNEFSYRDLSWTLKSEDAETFLQYVQYAINAGYKLTYKHGIDVSGIFSYKGQTVCGFNVSSGDFRIRIIYNKINEPLEQSKEFINFFEQKVIPGFGPCDKSCGDSCYFKQIKEPTEVIIGNKKYFLCSGGYYFGKPAKSILDYYFHFIKMRENAIKS